MKHKWTIWTSIYLLEWCIYAWRNYMWMHLDGFTNEDLMRRSFWYYLNYGMTGNEMDLQDD
jgi:hypothetical protein